MKNLAFIDGQNLHFGTNVQKGWSVDHWKFRAYLRDKYNVSEAYYFLGFVSDEEQVLYNNLQKAGFILSFREHSAALKGKKKGNVDSDIIYEVMKRFLDLVEGKQDKEFDKVVLVSGDGDFKRLVDFLVKRDRLEKILFPNKEFASSLYKRLGGEYFDNLDNSDIKKKIIFTPK